MKKIKSLRLTIDAYVLVWDELDLFFRLVWPWFVLCVLAYLTLDLYDLRSSESPGRYILLFIYSVSFTAFSVTWQRVVLAGEIGKGGAPFSFGRREMHFLAIYTLLMSPILFIDFLADSVIEAASEDAKFNTGLGANIIRWGVSILWLPVMMRLSMRLPAISVDNTRMTFIQSWHCTKKNTLRLSFGALLIWVPFLLLLVLFSVSAPVWGQLPYATLILYALPIIALSFVAIGAGYLSMAYKVLAVDPQQSAETYD